MEIGTKVIMKSDNAEGFIQDKWNPQLINPNVFKNCNHLGFSINVNGTTRICTEEDFITTR